MTKLWIKDNFNPALFGYFKDDSETPTYDPGKSSCLVCGENWNKSDVKTISLGIPGDTTSYFYRVHKSCYESLNMDEKIEVDGELIDKIANIMRMQDDE